MVSQCHTQFLYVALTPFTCIYYNVTAVNTATENGMLVNRPATGRASRTSTPAAHFSSLSENASFLIYFDTITHILKRWADFDNF
jgi:hypothetical protein